MEDPERSEPTEAAPAARTEQTLAPWSARIPLGIAGIGLFAGFFLPWVHVGQLAELSGLSLAVTGGQFVEEMSGPSRALVLVVPLAGLALAGAAVRGHRALSWLGLASGCVIFAVGLYTLIRLFLDATGFGMWLVTLSTVLAMAIGLMHTRRR